MNGFVDLRRLGCGAEDAVPLNSVFEDCTRDLATRYSDLELQRRPTISFLYSLIYLPFRS